jgi:elongation factor P
MVECVFLRGRASRQPGKGRAIYKFRMRKTFHRNVLDNTYHSGDKFEETSVTMHEMQYLFQERR